MCKFIGVEILAANALIEAIESETSKSVSLKKLEAYGIKVVNFLQSQYKEQAVILYNENKIGNEILNYSEYLKIENETITKKEGVSVNDLRRKFRAPLAYALLKAFLCEDARNVILNK